jgi:lipoprotein-anchoring transpeptidase ErfK/SrfK
VNSHFGDDTLHAVRAFQKVQRTAVTGVVSEAVWNRLSDPVAPRARYVSSRPAVEVDLTRRVLYLTHDGVVTAVFDISPGKPSTPTVRGRFTIYRRINSWHHAPLGGLYRPNFFHGGYALHGSLSVPTYAASHGCVRLTTGSMDRLYPLLSLGESVSLYRS